MKESRYDESKGDESRESLVVQGERGRKGKKGRERGRGAWLEGENRYELAYKLTERWIDTEMNKLKLKQAKGREAQTHT